MAASSRMRATRLDRWDAVITGYALLAALARPLTAPAAVAVLVPGVLLLALRARRPVAPLPSTARPRPGVALWLGLGAVLGLWEIVAIAWGNDADHPTLSLLADPLLDTYPGRVLGYLAWLVAGRWLVTR
ncbi:hypothetical protein ACVGVM_03760 [Pseudonocardia bannensis]|uniref:Uncharacterized protein n=1 Tax=Pseudonocardia bannensis TaxID=630973 RepID=A0A848DN40_9PSEU|nr:hypothetical protein [Pseudonocardia bannensis]NMH94197.1 hypothetical protein [Pseudonocardia bannensis]